MFIDQNSTVCLDNGFYTPENMMPLTSTGIILSMGSANERWCYNVMSSFIGWTHTQNDPALSLYLKEIIGNY